MTVVDGMSMNSVPILQKSAKLTGTVDDIIEFSKGHSLLNPSVDREGIVIRSIEETYSSLIGRLSFKAVNPDYLLKYE